MFSISIGASIRFLIDGYGRVLILFVLLVIAIRSVRDLALLTWSFVFSTGILIFLAFTVLELQPTNTGLGRLEGQGMYDGNDLGMILLMALPLSLLLFFTCRHFVRWCSLFVVFGIPVTIALTGSRGAMVGLAVVGPVLFFMLKQIQTRYRLMIVGLLLGGLVVGAPPGYWAQMKTILNPTADYNYTVDYGRKAVAQRGVGYMLENPVFGLGIDNFRRAEGTLSQIAARREMDGESVQWVAPHNTYVQVGAELGIPALIVWFSLIAGVPVALIRLRKQLSSPAIAPDAEIRFLRDSCMYLPVAYLSFAVTSFFLSHAYTPPLYILTALSTGVIVLARERTTGSPSKAGRL